ncbi:tetratricopeptide repeat protein [Algivirga pacifica]|uniref:Tetratricopeptide repeat-containing protein n=1 Tax=Algivirga pacifica TaxID=1162670 RepID=A0ABP9DA25_9BACT
MNQQRLEQLFNFLKEEPNDPFLIYAIANEYNGHDDEKALQYYHQLLEEHPNYTGTYYHVAALYLHLGNEEKAEELYKKGIMICQQEGDRHALSELQRAYNDWLFDDDE